MRASSGCGLRRSSDSLAALRSLKRGLILAASTAAETGRSCVGISRPEVVLVLGHMRSGSTLLLHILLSHPSIAGLGERNAMYASGADLSRLVFSTMLARRSPFARFRYVVDQINHSRFTPEPSVLHHPRVRLLFLIREPLGTIASLLELTRKHYEPWPVERAVGYYVERVSTLTQYARSITQPERTAFLTYEDVTERSTESLSGLAAFLGTETPFPETYPVHDFTGRRGDPGPVISGGRIVQARTHSLPMGSDAHLARAQQAYEESLRALKPFALVSN